MTDNGLDWTAVAEAVNRAFAPIRGAVSEGAETGDEPSVRAQVLREAESLVCGDREDQYGHPRDNLARIAGYWNDYLFDAVHPSDLLTPRDVALMMVLVKVAREAAGHKRDSCVDIAGYAAIAAEVSEAE